MPQQGETLDVYQANCHSPGIAAVVRIRGVYWEQASIEEAWNNQYESGVPFHHEWALWTDCSQGGEHLMPEGRGYEDWAERMRASIASPGERDTSPFRATYDEALDDLIVYLMKERIRLKQALIAVEERLCLASLERSDAARLVLSMALASFSALVYEDGPVTGPQEMAVQVPYAR